MDKRIAPIALVAYFLIIVTYTLGFVEKYNTIIGLMILISTIVFVLLLIKYFLTDKKAVKQEEFPTSNQTIGKKVIAKGKLTVKDTRQTTTNKSSIGKQSIGDGAIAGEDILFEKIQQNNK